MQATAAPSLTPEFQATALGKEGILTATGALDISAALKLGALFDALNASGGSSVVLELGNPGRM